MQHPASFSLSGCNAAHDGSNGPPDFEIRNLTPMPVPYISMLDFYLEEELQDPYNPLRAEIKGAQPDGSYVTPASESDDELVFHELLLSQYQATYGEFAVRTLEQEFELAKVAEMKGHHEVAEYHCLNILDHRGPQVTVQTFLGMVYLNTSCPEKATSSLFLALTDFIIEFTSSTLESNDLRLRSFEELFTRLASQNGQQWTPLYFCMRRMNDEILRAVRDGNTDEIFPKLLIHGISFARELNILEGNIEPKIAEQMYKSLLQNSSGEDVFLHGIEFTTAHHEYGLLLKRKGKWLDCADQFLLACEFALFSGPHNSQLISSLKCDCFDVLLYFGSKSDESEVLERINKALARLRRNYPVIKDKSEDGQLSRVEEYLLSDLPIVLNEDCEPVLLETGPPTHEIEKGTIRTSTASKSTSLSHKYGLLTYPESDATGISNSVYMVP